MATNHLILVESIEILVRKAEGWEIEKDTNGKDWEIVWKGELN